jgi:hypothetical protein
VPITLPGSTSQVQLVSYDLNTQQLLPCLDTYVRVLKAIKIPINSYTFDYTQAICIFMQLPAWHHYSAEEDGGLPDKEDCEPPKGLLPAGPWNHICTQGQQVMRKGHIESEMEF